MVPEGYSQLFLLLIFVIGIQLAMIRPYGVFLFSCTLMVAGSRFAFITTRTAIFGPYLNMGDACVLVALLGLVVDKWQNKARFSLPSLLIVILSVLFVAAMQSFAKLGWTYETIRGIRWALAFPIGLFLGANFVNSTQRAKLLIIALLFERFVFKGSAYSMIFLVLLFLAILLTHFLMITLGNKKQSLHDRIARTYVVKTS